MANWFKKLTTPEINDDEDHPKDFFGEILELSNLAGKEKDYLVDELGDFTGSESVETEIFLQNAKRKDADNPWNK